MIARELDQFYTKKEVAAELFEMLEQHFDMNNFTLVEPSAGTGSFSSLFHDRKIAIDIDPKDPTIEKANFLEIHPDYFKSKGVDVFTIGNPPFGKNSSLALKFLNHSAKFSKYIGFILPKTFAKKSMIKKIDPLLHCIMSIELPKNSFVFDNEAYDVPVFFQVWQKREDPRPSIKTKLKSDLFSFTTKYEADFAIRRVGGLSGKVIVDFNDYSERSHYYIKISNPGKRETLTLLFKNLYSEFQKVAKNTAGNPSISKDELIEIIENSVKK